MLAMVWALYLVPLRGVGSNEDSGLCYFHEALHTELVALSHSPAHAQREPQFL